MRPNPSIATLHQILRYEPDTGRLFWRDRDRNLSGLEAGGTASPDGYRRIRINGQIRLAHRIILAMTTGEWPLAQVDHINGNRADNRIENLRSVSRAENQRNKATYRSNTSGISGVYWHKQSLKWCVAVQSGGKRKFIGLFCDIEAARAARNDAAQAVGLHPNHGRKSA